MEDQLSHHVLRKDLVTVLVISALFVLLLVGLSLYDGTREWFQDVGAKLLDSL